MNATLWKPQYSELFIWSDWVVLDLYLHCFLQTYQPRLLAIWMFFWPRICKLPCYKASPTCRASSVCANFLACCSLGNGSLYQLIHSSLWSAYWERRWLIFSVNIPAHRHGIFFPVSLQSLPLTCCLCLNFINLLLFLSLFTLCLSWTLCSSCCSSFLL